VYRLLNAVEEWEQGAYTEVHELQRKQWSKPPIFAVGDAAHATLPFWDNGINAAIVDALVLLQLLAPALHSGSNLDAVARQYQAVRGPFVERLRRLAQRGAVDARRADGWLHGIFGRASRGLSSEQMLLCAGYNPLEAQYFDIEPQAAQARG
jgi:2-polyprenyl-6-methoxyphenol hydroxylase-like FAD-dependent oxidoreductase